MGSSRLGGHMDRIGTRCYILDHHRTRGSLAGAGTGEGNVGLRGN